MTKFVASGVQNNENILLFRLIQEYMLYFHLLSTHLYMTFPLDIQSCVSAALSSVSTRPHDTSMKCRLSVLCADTCAHAKAAQVYAEPPAPLCASRG